MAYFVGFFNGESHQTPAQAAQRSCGVPILGDIQALTDHVPEKSAPGDPALRREMDKKTFRCPYLPLGFCNFPPVMPETASEPLMALLADWRTLTVPIY